MPRNTKNSVNPPEHVPAHFPGITGLNTKSCGPHFRDVLWTGLFSQVVTMNIPVGGDIGEEVHSVDQALTFTQGKALAVIGGDPGQGGKDGKGNGGGGEIRKQVNAGDMLVVPAGTRHQFWNVGDEPLVLYTVYAPAEHHPQTYHHTAEEGEEEEENGQDEAPEWAGLSKKQNLEKGIINLEGKY